MPEELKVVGKPLPYQKAPGFVTGKAKFTADRFLKLERTGVLYGRILRSPYPHAMIRSIDTSKAEALPGVKAVITYKDAPSKLLPMECSRPRLILDPHIRYVGDLVAAVAAETPEIAEEALDLIKVDYEILKPVFDPEEAAKPEAPKLWPEGNIVDPGNKPYVIEEGNIEEGFKEADFIIKKEFTTQIQPHMCLEPHAYIAKWEEDKLTVWASTQTPTEIRIGLAEAFSMPSAKVRVISENTGGGSMGSKYLEEHVGVAALLAKKAGRPVKLVLNRYEVAVHRRRYSSKHYIKIGVKKDGTLTALDWKSFWDVGAGGTLVGGSLFGLDVINQYKFLNKHIEFYDVSTNLPTAQPYRSVPYPALNFALESMIDMAAEVIGMDPIEIRLKNAPREGEIVAGKKLSTFPIEECMKRACELINWSDKWMGFGKPYKVEGSKRRAVGVAYTAYSTGHYEETRGPIVNVMVDQDGSVYLITPTQDMGTGSTTTLAQIVAEEFGLDLKEVRVVSEDTSHGLIDLYNARASRELCTGGLAAIAACKDAKRKIAEIAAPKLGVKPEEIEVKEKKVYVKEEPEKAIPLSEVLAGPIPIVGTGKAEPLPTDVNSLDPVVCIADIEVDTKTGELNLLKCAFVLDAGRAINPKIVENQIEGGVLPSVGLALREEFIFDEANLVNLGTNYLDFKLITSADCPEVEAGIVESIDPYGPYGAKGLGEVGTTIPHAAIANAVYNAIGARITSLPITPDKILRALGKV